MVARTLPFKPRARDKPNEELPSISDEMQRQIEADQKDIKKQLKHAQQQLDLTNVYPARGRQQPRGLPRQGLESHRATVDIRGSGLGGR
jgi:hypothetical protein